MTRLEGFIKQAGVKPSRLAERAGVSRQHLPLGTLGMSIHELDIEGMAVA